MTDGGAPRPAQLILYTDARAKVIEVAYAMLGRGLPGETGTIASLEVASLAAILGDGTGVNPGLGNAKWQQLIADSLRSAAAGVCYDAFYARQAQLMRTLDDLVQAGMPTGWRFAAIRPLDGYLTRLNGAQGAPTPPVSYIPGVLTAQQSAAGAMPAALAGAAPRVVHTLVGSTDELETLPTVEATQVGLSGPQNSLSYQIAGVVPTGIVKVRVYRTPFGASGPPYIWDQDVAVSAGSSYPAILLVQPDPQLRLDIQPPAWMQCALRPGAAALYALAFASSSGFAANGGSGGQIGFNSLGMLSPGNVLLGPASGFVGVGNPVQSALFGASLLTGAGASTFSAGGISTVNSSSQNLQGYAGAMGLRARCTAPLNGTLTPVVTINYCSAAHGWSSVQTLGGLIPSTGFTTGLVGDTAIFTLPAGAVVQSLSETSVSGTASSGSWVYEAVFPRV